MGGVYIRGACGVYKEHGELYRGYRCPDLF